MASSPHTSDAVRRIVEEVLTRIAAETGRAPAALAPAPPPNPAPLPAGSVTVAQRVITLDAINRLPAGIRQVFVPAGAVVTPSARDQARELGLAFVTVTTTANAAAVRPCVIAHADSGADVARRCAAIARGVPAAQQLPASGLAQVVSEIALLVVRDGSRGILLTGRPAMACVMANRHGGVRAVAARDAAAASRAAGQCAANLLIVDPRDFSGNLERTCVDFATRVADTVPPELLAMAPHADAPCACRNHAH